MAVVNVRAERSGSTGQRARGGKNTYAIPYFVDTDDTDDQAGTIIAWFEANGLGLGIQYAHGNDTDLTSYCDKITPTLDPGSTTRWRVVRSFSPLDEKQGKDENGNPTDDPNQYGQEYNKTFSLVSVPVYIATLLTDLTNAPNVRRGLGSAITPMNAAGVPYDPPLMGEESIAIWRITRNTPTFDDTASNGLNNSVNAVATTLADTYAQVTIAIPQYHGKILAHSTSFRLINAVRTWTTQWEIGIRDAPGWAVDVVNRGLTAPVAEGLPDGRGGTYSADDIKPGMPPHRPLTGGRGQPLPEPVLLDLLGQPLPSPLVGVGVQPTYIRWLWEPSTDFELIPLSPAFVNS